MKFGKLLLILPVVGLFLFLVVGGRVYSKESEMKATVDFSGETIYFLMIDRFCDGDPANNKPEKLFSPDHSNLTLYQGGDLKGIISKLDYIRDLGATALWITPVIKNTQDLYNYGSKDMASYHGYWGMDFYTVNPQFGDLKDFKNLADECHKRGIKLILDFVLNHTSPIKQGCDGALYKNGKFIANYGKDPKDWFHHNGTVNFSDENFVNWQTRNLFDLADLNQENPLVDEYLKDAGRFWLQQGIDGFRIDTARFITAEWLASFRREMQKEKPNFIFAEWSQGGPDVAPTVDFEKASGMPILDFSFQKNVAQCLAGGSPMKWIAEIIAQDKKLTQPLQRVNFIDNHDMPRFLSIALNSGLSLKVAKDRLEMALALLMTSRGIPCIYYGTEQYLHNETRSEWGTGGEPYNRQMMENFNRRTKLCDLIYRLSALRKGSAALQKGEQVTVKADDNLYIYQRTFGSESVLVALNKGDDIDLEVDKLNLADGIYCPERGSKVEQDMKACSLNRLTLFGNQIMVNKGKARLKLGKNSIGVWFSAGK